VYVTEQDAIPVVVPGARLQVADDGVKVPVEFVVKPSVPVGVMTVPGEVSATITVQVEATPTLTELGTQETEVEVE
jgi:hypothetical protein